MNFIGIESISAYQGVYEFKIYEYDCEINLSDNEKFICDLKIIINKIEPRYENKIEKNMEVLALVKSLNRNLDKESIVCDLKSFVIDEIWEETIEKENIELMFIES